MYLYNSYVTIQLPTMGYKNGRFYMYTSTCLITYLHLNFKFINLLLHDIILRMNFDTQCGRPVIYARPNLTAILKTQSILWNHEDNPNQLQARIAELLFSIKQVPVYLNMIEQINSRNTCILQWSLWWYLCVFQAERWRTLQFFRCTVFEFPI